PALLESPSRVIYRAYATALLKMLTETPEGPARLARFVADLPRAANDPLADLLAHFPELGGSVVVAEKNWQRAIAQQSLGNNFPILDCRETERQLAQTLQITAGGRARPPMNYSLEEFSKFASLPDAAKSLKDLSRELVVFSGRANPLYLPVIFEYEKIIARLARRKTKHIAERLAEARSQREQISRTMQGIDDYMNWFEVTQSRTTSGAFRDYMKAAEVSLEPQPRRRDPISVYLDAFEPLLQP
nr:cytochrome P450 [Verrucomicrobiota bacterium]